MKKQLPYRVAPVVSKVFSAYVKKIIAISLVGILLLMALPWESHATEEDDFQLIAETDILRLYYSESYENVKVVDKRNGNIWSGVVDETFVAKAGMTDYFAKKASSLLLLHYTDLNKVTNVKKEMAVTELKRELTIKALDQGIELQYFFKDLKMRLSIQITVHGDTLTVCIPEEGFQEQIGVNEFIQGKVDKTKEHFAKIDTLVKEADTIKLSDKAMKNQIKRIKSRLYLYHKNVKLIGEIESLQESAYRVRDDIFEANTRIIGEKGSKGLKQIIKESKDEHTQEILDIYTKISKECVKIMAHLQGLVDMKTAGMTRIDVLPFLGAAHDYDKGYMVYPDGSGALTYYKKVHQEWSEYFNKSVYSGFSTKLDKIRLLKEKGYENIALPVIGVHKNGKGFVATVSKGASYSDANFYPSGYNMNVNHINFGYVYRYIYDYAMDTKSQDDRSVDTGARYGSKEAYTQDRVAMDHEVKYMFLDNEDCEYSGMANRIRQYYEETGELAKSDEMEREELPLGLDLFMGIYEKRILFDKFIRMTTYKQALHMVQQLVEEGIHQMQVGLVGWMKDGYTTSMDKFTLEKKLGTRSDFNHLGESLEDLGITLFLSHNPVDAKDNGLGSVNTIKDVVRTKNTKQLTDRFLRWFVMSTGKVLRTYRDAFLKNFAKLPIAGSAFQRIGDYIYEDYNKAYGVKTRQDIIEDYERFMTMSKEQFGKVATSGGNLYTLSLSDRLMEVPLKSTEYFFTDKSIPFYQLVVHGYIPYTSKPINLYYDSKREKLRDIEYGNIPYYKLTYSASDEMIYTDYTKLFSSAFHVWKEDVVDTYEDYRSRMGNLWKLHMTGHETVKSQVVKVTYEDGSRVYLNYREEAVTVDGITIQPLDYRVVRKEGN